MMNRLKCPDQLSRGETQRYHRIGIEVSSQTQYTVVSRRGAAGRDKQQITLRICSQYRPGIRPSCLLGHFTAPGVIGGVRWILRDGIPAPAKLPGACVESTDLTTRPVGVGIIGIRLTGHNQSVCYNWRRRLGIIQRYTRWYPKASPQIHKTLLAKRAAKLTVFRIQRY